MATNKQIEKKKTADMYLLDEATYHLDELVEMMETTNDGAVDHRDSAAEHIKKVSKSMGKFRGMSKRYREATKLMDQAICKLSMIKDEMDEEKEKLDDWYYGDRLGLNPR